MSRYTADSDLDYAEEIGDLVPRGSEDSPKFRCVECNRKMRPLDAFDHSVKTGHVIRYRGRIVRTKGAA